MKKVITKIDQVTIDILESFYDNIMIYNREGMLLYACQKFWIDTGLTPEEFEGKGINEIKELGVYEPYLAEMAFVSNEKSTVVQRAFKNEIAVATALPIKDKDGDTFIIVSYAERNERIIELERKLAQAKELLSEKNAEISKLLTGYFYDPEVLGTSTEVLKVHKTIKRIMNFDANVLLTGETGVGKTMYAEKIHSTSQRKEFPFIEINCAAIPENLLESELFGYEAGAFTGASEKGKQGQIELAAGGTLFLDEISELSMGLQSKLLKVIQDKKIMRIGGTESIDVDFRLIAASNKDLEALIENKAFRADLYYRLNVILINVPPLRDRKEDILTLSKQFLINFNRKYNENKYLSKEAIHYMSQYDWPGNIRELENTLERLVLTVESDEINVIDISQDIGDHSLDVLDKTQGVQYALDELEKRIIEEVYKEHHGNISATAKELKLTRQSLIRRLEKYGFKK